MTSCKKLNEANRKLFYQNWKVRFCPTLPFQKVSGSDMIEPESWFLLKASSKLVFTMTTHTMSSCVFWSTCRHYACTQLLLVRQIPTFHSRGWWQKPGLATIQSKSRDLKYAFCFLTADLESPAFVFCVQCEKSFSDFLLEPDNPIRISKRELMIACYLSHLGLGPSGECTFPRRAYTVRLK